jgi:hypothetical protein
MLIYYKVYIILAILIVVPLALAAAFVWFNEGYCFVYEEGKIYSDSGGLVDEHGKYYHSQKSLCDSKYNWLMSILTGDQAVTPAPPNV